MKSFSGTRKFCLALLALVLLSTAFVAFGCSGNTATVSNPSTSISAQTTEEVDSIDLLINIVYPGTGLQVLLIPKDDDGLLVEAEGDINIKLSWQFGYGVEATKGNLIQEWNIHITSDDYTQFLGASIELIYNEAIHYQDVYVYGFFDVTLTTPDGKILTAELPDFREIVC